jgi:hypothetical protein
MAWCSVKEKVQGQLYLYLYVRMMINWAGHGKKWLWPISR